MQQSIFVHIPDRTAVATGPTKLQLTLMNQSVRSIHIPTSTIPEIAQTYVLYKT